MNTSAVIYTRIINGKENLKEKDFETILIGYNVLHLHFFVSYN